ncbi:peptide-methionine (S)-S-oxide reductase MsrA [soil metagenome]
MNLETITLGGGCFWCIEAILKDLKGVDHVVSGYAGGNMSNPTYHQVTSGTTGHAEVVQVYYDTSTISTTDLLRIFFTLHNPTTKNQQGADVGTQYRSIVLTSNEAQVAEVRKVMDEVEAEGVWGAPLVTEVQPLRDFYPAEDYHQDYYAQNTMNPYCQVVIEPKVVKLRKLYRDRLKEA